MAGVNLETVPGQRGFLVMSDDGALLQSSGELQNDEHTGELMLRMMKNSLKLVKSVNEDRKNNVQRLTVSYRTHSLVASIWNHKLYVVKRINPEI